MPVDREQERAARAFARVQGIGAEDRGDFLQKARELPTILRTNGLLAGWAYLQAKHEVVAGALREHLESRFPAAFGKVTALFRSGEPGAERLSTLELQRLTAEAVVYAGWLKRAAEAVCNVGGERDEGAS